MTDTDAFYRRHLPHWQPPGATIFFTWRLYGSLPAEALERLAEERPRLEREPARPAESWRDRSLRHNKQLLILVDTLLAKNRSGPHWLREEPIARLVTDAFFFHASRLYTLLAFVVMPNHVHLLLTPLPVKQACSLEGQAGKPVPQDGQAGKPDPQYVPLATITQSLKGYTAREANRLLRRTGRPFWQDECYDHWARTEAELGRIVDYVESDPVRSGLIGSPEAWRWSSAWEREYGRLKRDKGTG